MSTLRVEVVKIDGTKPIAGADRIELAQVQGWEVVVGKGQYKAGDLAIYFPIDSVLSEAAENALFSADSKIKLKRRRVRTTKIRGVYSQGLLGSIDDLHELIGWPRYNAGDDVCEVLGVTKYEPPVRGTAFTPGAGKKRRMDNPNFPKFTDLENIKWWPQMFGEGEQVVITEKIHGTNFRAGWAKTHVNTWWRKVKKFFGFLPEYEFVVGSRNVELQSGDEHTFYGENVYHEVAELYNLKQVLRNGQIIYGEIYGSKIQPGYTYGCEAGERKLVVFDVSVECGYLHSPVAKQFCEDRGLPFVPVLFEGEYTAAKMEECTVGKSVLCPEQKIREGCVVRPAVETETLHGRKILKSINPAYLTKADDMLDATPDDELGDESFGFAH